MSTNPKQNSTATTFTANQTGPGTQLKIKKSENNQPPKKNVGIRVAIKSIFEFSPKKNRANHIPAYSVLYPETNSGSASGKSNGILAVSANALTKNINATGNIGTIYQTYLCANTISLKFSEPTQRSTLIRIKPIDTSY